MIGTVIQRWASEIEGNVMLLFAGMIFFAAMLIFVEYKFQQDSVVFQAVSNILSGFAGAFFGIMSKKPNPVIIPALETTTTIEKTITK